MASNLDNENLLFEEMQEPRSLKKTKSKKREMLLHGLLGLCSLLFVGFFVSLAVNNTSGLKMHLTNQSHRKLGAAMRATDQKLVWLISFPESGVTYLSHIIQELSGTSMATNNGGRVLDDQGRAVSIWSSIPVYFTITTPTKMSFTKPVPQYYILTRSHSYGTEYEVPPWEYIGPFSQYKHNVANFYASYVCEGTMKVASYDQSFVEKVVVLMRDPMDTVVARFYQRIGRAKLDGDWGYAQKYPLSKNGFLEYCKNSDNDHNEPRRKHWFAQYGFGEYVDGIPCQEEFVKLFSFHNQVLEMSRQLGLDFLPITTKELASNFDATIQRLFRFVRLVRISNQNFGFPGGGSKEFFFFFTDDERAAVARLAKAMLDPVMWDKYSQYLGEYL